VVGTRNFAGSCSNSVQGHASPTALGMRNIVR
jgi:hypothetical protein